MWIAKLRLKHDCMIGNRCEKYNVSAIGVPLDVFKEENKYYYSHFNTLVGDKENVEAFVKDLRNDKKVGSVEFEGNTLFFLVALPVQKKIPTANYHGRIFFSRPVIVDNKGYEHWEIGSWKKEYLTEFISSTKKETHNLEEFKIIKIEKTKLTDVYFPHIMPNLTKGQKEAITLAHKYGYYDYPRKIELKDLAKISKMSISTYREHLRKAEKKLMPDLIKTVDNEY